MKNLYKKIEAIHQQDPVLEVDCGLKIPREMLYSQHMVNKLKALVPDAKDVLVVSAMCHHIGRWEIERKSFPEGKSGYHQWRNAVHIHQAEKARVLMIEEDIKPEFQERVLRIIKKEGIKKDTEVQLIEDIACIVFVEEYIEAFSRKYTDDKLLVIIRKTLAKMSAQGHQWLFQSKVPERILGLVQKLNL